MNGYLWEGTASHRQNLGALLRGLWAQITVLGVPTIPSKVSPSTTASYSPVPNRETHAIVVSSLAAPVPP